MTKVMVTDGYSNLKEVALTGRWYISPLGFLWLETKGYWWQRPKFIVEDEIRELFGEYCE